MATVAASVILNMEYGYSVNGKPVGASLQVAFEYDNGDFDDAKAYLDEDKRFIEVTYVISGFTSKQALEMYNVVGGSEVSPSSPILIQRDRIITAFVLTDGAPV